MYMVSRDQLKIHVLWYGTVLEKRSNLDGNIDQVGELHLHWASFHD